MDGEMDPAEAARVMQEASLRSAAAFASDGRSSEMDGDTLVDCLLGDGEPPSEWRPHMRRLLGGEEATFLQDLVHSGVCSFTDIEAAAERWRVDTGLLRGWLADMAARERSVPTT